MYIHAVSIGTLQFGDLYGLLIYWTPTAIGIAFGGLLSAYVYLKTRKIKRLAYIVTTENLIQDASATLSGIQVTFHGQPTDNISVSKVTLWNAGSDVINGTDIAGGDPLRLVISAGKLMDAVLVRASMPSEVGIGQSQDRLQISFDYLDKNHGAKIQLVHTALSSQQVLLLGSLKGCSIIRGPFASNKWLGRIESFLSSVYLIPVLVVFIEYIGSGRLPGPILIFIGSGLTVLLFVASEAVGYMRRRVGAIPKAFES